MQIYNTELPRLYFVSGLFLAITKALLNHLPRHNKLPIITILANGLPAYDACNFVFVGHSDAEAI